MSPPAGEEGVLTDVLWDPRLFPLEQVERLGFTLIEDLGQQAASKVGTRAGQRRLSVCLSGLLLPALVTGVIFRSRL